MNKKQSTQLRQTYPPPWLRPRAAAQPTWVLPILEVPDAVAGRAHRVRCEAECRCDGALSFALPALELPLGHVTSPLTRSTDAALGHPRAANTPLARTGPARQPTRHAALLWCGKWIVLNCFCFWFIRWHASQWLSMIHMGDPKHKTVPQSHLRATPTCPWRKSDAATACWRLTAGRR